MHIEVITEILISLFAVYGVFCALQLLLEHLFFARAFYLAVSAEKGENVERVNHKLSYARLISARERGAKSEPFIVVPEGEDEERIDALKKLGVKVYSTRIL